MSGSQDTTGGSNSSVDATTIRAWEDDPGTGVLRDAPVPDLSKTPLAFGFPTPAPAAGIYQIGTPEFRYWTAAEALRRGADFWAPRVPLTQWEVGPTLQVILDEAEDLNAYYDRNALNFFHGAGPDGTVYSGESPDVVCHEMGHAILDSFKPELWGAGSQEVAGFHESFADISALLSAIQVPSLRADILGTIGGTLYQSTRLSRLAEQLGAAIRAQQPDAVEPDCLRNAVNAFTYQDPTTLPNSGPSATLSSEPHSFSRVFTAAFFEALGTGLTARAADPANPTDAEFVAVADDFTQILVAGIKAAPVVSNWYAQVASSMVQAAASVQAAYPPILNAVFVRRSILSMQSATGIANLAHMFAAAAPGPAGPRPALPVIALQASDYGLAGVLYVESPAQLRRFVATAAAPDNTPIEPSSGNTAARVFVDDLFQRGRVDYGDAAEGAMVLDHGNKLRTHRLVKVEGGAKLERILFDCGYCRHR